MKTLGLTTGTAVCESDGHLMLAKLSANSTPEYHLTLLSGKPPEVTSTADSGRFLISIPGDSIGNPFRYSRKDSNSSGEHFLELQGMEFSFHFLKLTLRLHIMVLAGLGPLPVIH